MGEQEKIIRLPQYWGRGGSFKKILFMPHLSGITIYPLKSLGPVSVTQTRIVEGGGLEHDREFAFFDADGKYVNGKRTPKIHQLRAALDWKDGTLFLQTRDGSQSGLFLLHREREAAESGRLTFSACPSPSGARLRAAFPMTRTPPARR